MAGITEHIIDVDIVAEDRPLWSGEAVSVVVPTTEGYLGILADHEPILALVGNGTVEVKLPGAGAAGGSGSSAGQSAGVKHFDVKGGFIAFEDNRLTIGVDQCMNSDEDAANEEGTEE